MEDNVSRIHTLIFGDADIPSSVRINRDGTNFPSTIESFYTFGLRWRLLTVFARWNAEVRMSPQIYRRLPLDLVNKVDAILTQRIQRWLRRNVM